MCPPTHKRFAHAIPVALLLLVLPGCMPFLADQQSARLLPEGDVEVTPSFSSVSFSAQGETAHIQDQYGVRLGYGAADQVELRATYERIRFVGGDGGLNVIGAGIKTAIVPDVLAFYLPVGFVTGTDIQTRRTWTVAPTLLATYRAGQTFEITPSAKAIYPFAAQDPQLFLGFHLGAGISTDLDVWALRPEVGLVVNPGDEGVSWGWTLGISVRP
jgi:hypothetical protein